MRVAEIKRKTKETDIELVLNLDGSGKAEISSGCGFLDHMLTLLTRHARFDMSLKCVGDVEVDYHHTAEDIGICIGRAIKEALGKKEGINRYGDTVLPMDEALIMTAVDVSGRGYLGYNVKTRAKKVGDFDVELVEEFLIALTQNAGINLHVNQISGRNTHHVLEGVFKSTARSLKEAFRIDERLRGEVPSTKGVL